MDHELNSCRICAKSVAVRNLVPIHSASKISALKYSDLICSIAPTVKIQRDDTISEKICHLCCKKSKEAYKFQQICINSFEGFNEQIQDEKSEVEIVLVKEELDERILIDYNEPVKQETESTCLVDSPVYKIEIEEPKIAFESNLGLSIPQKTEEEKLKIKKARKLPKKSSARPTKKPSTQEKPPRQRRPFQCTTCKLKFPTELFFKRHQVVHSSLVKVVRKLSSKFCKICDKETGHIMKFHIKQHENDKICHICDRDCKNVRALLRHLRTHEDYKTHACTKCNKLWVMGSDFIDHLNHHIGFEEFQCDHCGNVFSRKSKLMQHMKYHLKFKTFLCTVCGVAFYPQNALKLHMLTHTNTRDFICAFCNKGFKNKGE